MMMMRRLTRLLIAMAMAVFFAGATLVIAQAQTPTPPVPTPDAGTKQPVSGTPTAAVPVTYDTCVDCHKDIQDNWQMGPHGQAMTDPVFVAEWNNQGKPGACRVCHATGYDPATGAAKAEGVTCENCHSPIPPNHPVDNMPVDKSPDLCGRCHSDTRFATENWQMSAHYKRSMTCSVCHDAHSAGMKQIDGAPVSADASDLCANCHKDAMKNFPTSKHSAAGVTCVNCHLGFNVGPDTTGKLDFISAHRAPDHNFTAKLETCNKCHADQMHSPGQAAAAAAIKVEQAGGTATPEPTAAVTPIPHTTTQPAPVSPVGFAAMAGLLGLAGGMVLAPWLERAYRKGKGAKND
jgi:predicted CXXCH cytochrome family protein